MPRERWKYDESERAMAQEFIEWALPLVNATSFVKVAVRLGVSRRGLAAVVNNKRGWRRRKDPVRQVWIDHRERLLQTSLTDLIAECEAAKERKDAESAQAEVSDSEAPDARSEDSSTIEPSTEDSEGSEESAPDEVTLTDVSTVVAPDVPVADVNAADPPLTEGDVYEVPEIDVPAGAFAPEPVDEDEGEAPQRGTKSADEAVSISGDTPCAETPVEEVGGVLQAGGMAGNAESTVTGDQKMPAILDLEEMSALIDARRPRGSYGQPPMTVMVDDRLMNVANERDFRELQELIVSAQTHEEVARIAGAPVLAVYPGLSLENAKICALMRIGGWHPTERDREPPGLQGDAPLMLYNGLPADFVHPGAMALAFARTLMWKDTHGLSATRMRYGCKRRSDNVPRRRLDSLNAAVENRTACHLPIESIETLMEGDKDVHRGHVFARAQGVPGGWRWRLRGRLCGRTLTACRRRVCAMAVNGGAIMYLEGGSTA